MTYINPKTKVLVTGANGYIAMWIIQCLLEEGYSVRGTVRDQTKISGVLEYFPKEDKDSNLEVVVTGELTQKGAFDEAVRDVDAVIHVASPVQFIEGEIEDMVRPAKEGTLGLLESTRNHGTSVKRVIITSSVATISRVRIDPTCPGEKVERHGVQKVTEEDRNEESLVLCQELGRNAHGIDKYFAGKIAADDATWKFVQTYRDVKWDVVSLHPALVFGPSIQDWTEPDALNLTSRMFYDAIFTEMRAYNADDTCLPWVDVRDVGLGHVRALQEAKAGGQKIMLTANDSFIWNDFIVIANKLKATLPPMTRPIAPCFPNITSRYLEQWSNEKARKILDIEFKNKEQTTRDTLEAWARRGF